MKTYDYRPWRWACYNKRLDDSGPCPSVTAKTGDSLEGRVSYWSEDLNPMGYTGMLYRVEGPTGWSGDRWNKDYAVEGGTGVLTMSGETGPSGAYDVFWRVDVAGVTGMAHGQYYGLQVGVNTHVAQETGPHATAYLVIEVSNKFGG